MTWPRESWRCRYTRASPLPIRSSSPRSCSPRSNPYLPCNAAPAARRGAERMIDLVILGAAGTAIDVLDFIDDINRQAATYRCIGLLDDDPGKLGTAVAGVRVIGSLSHARQLNDVRFVDALGSPSSFRRRPEIVARTG